MVVAATQTATMNDLYNLPPETTILGNMSFGTSTLGPDQIEVMENWVFRVSLNIVNLHIGKGVHTIGEFSFADTTISQFSVDPVTHSSHVPALFL